MIRENEANAGIGSVRVSRMCVFHLWTGLSDALAFSTWTLPSVFMDWCCSRYVLCVHYSYFFSFFLTPTSLRHHCLLSGQGFTDFGLQSYFWLWAALSWLRLLSASLICSAELCTVTPSALAITSFMHYPWLKYSFFFFFFFYGRDLFILFFCIVEIVFNLGCD